MRVSEYLLFVAYYGMINCQIIFPEEPLCLI